LDFAAQTDKEPAALSVAGNEGAVTELLRHYERPIFSLVYRMVRDRCPETLIDISKVNPETMSRASIDVGAAEFAVRNLGNLNTRLIEIDAEVRDIELGFAGD
jgi:hypothetical protein